MYSCSLSKANKEHLLTYYSDDGLWFVGISLRLWDDYKILSRHWNNRPFDCLYYLMSHCLRAFLPVSTVVPG